MTNIKQGILDHFGMWPWIILLAIMLFTAAVRIRLLDVPLERDEGEYAYGGQMLLQGFLPYEIPSLYKYKLPGIYFLYAVILCVFGQTASAVHLGLLIANLTTILLLFLLAKKLFGHLAGVTTAAFYAIISLSTSVLGLFAHAEHFVVLAAVAGILLLLLAFENYRWWKLFLSGFLLGCAYVIRQHGAAFAAFGALYLLYQLIRQTKGKRLTAASHFIIFCAGTVSPLLLTCFVFLLAGTFNKFWFWAFVYARKNLDFMPFSVGMELLVENMSKIMVSSLLIWFLALLGFVALIKGPKLRSQRFFVLAFFVFSFLSVCPGMYFRRHYFVLLLPAVALFAGLGVTQIREYILRERQPWISNAASIGAVLIAIFFTVCLEYKVLFTLSPISVSRLTYGTNPFPESLEIASYIEKHSDSNDTVAILGSEPQILFYAKRRSPTGYTDTYEMMKSHPYAIQMQKEMIDEIEATSPKLIIFVHTRVSWLPEPGSHNLIFDWFEQYQQKYYRQVGVVDIRTAASTIYCWDAEAFNYEPVSENWIAVFKRRN